MDGFSAFVGALCAGTAMLIAVWGFDVGEASVSSRCEMYGKAKVGKVMLTCSVDK